MGENVAPSPQKRRGGKKHRRPRRGNAAKMAGKGQNTSAVVLADAHNANHPPGRAINDNNKLAHTKFANAPHRRVKYNARDHRHLISKPAYAAIDLGTNNCRLLIAKANGPDFVIVDAFSRVVRLGEGLTSTGRMSDQAMDRAVDALIVCADKLLRKNVMLARSVATEACRQAANGAQFIERVRRETGIVLDIIAPQEEARLAVMGCHALLEPGNGPALIFDIGGGSTELVLVSTDGDAPAIIDWVSVPWGVVSLTESERFDQEDGDTRKAGYAAMHGKVLNSFAAFASRLPKDIGSLRLLGTSGTVTTLASVYLKLDYYDRNKVDGLHLPTQSMREISQTLANLSPDGRAEFPTIGLERADLVVAGCAILEAIFDIWPGERLGIADRGIREGILRGLMANETKRGKRG
jgi:exopolyphosphatase / guanosine-5'-triphosphate,3'-diphosphate pyrophosphatase